MTGCPSSSDLALVGLVGAGEHLDQGGLAGAVLAEQAVHLAGPDLQVDAVQRPHARELLTMPRICSSRGCRRRRRLGGRIVDSWANVEALLPTVKQKFARW